MKDIPTEYSSEFIKESIISQNPGLVDEVLPHEEIRPIFKCGMRNRDVVEWVLDVSPIVYNAILNKRTFVGLISTFPRPYIFASHCRRCLTTDHSTKDCKNEVTCHHCAKPGHEKNNCQLKDKLPTFLHCGEQHSTLSKAYKICTQKLVAFQRLTDYGSTSKPSHA
jgi:hypothetical protein